jgi:D-sedoheptulose 7-phosphate isomerase
MNIDNFIEEQLLAAAMLRTALATSYRSQISAIAEAVVSTFLSGHKLLLCGNGGSASDAEHIAAEFVGRFRRNRVPLPAVALTANGADLTAIGNDFGFEEVFARQVEALGKPGDMLVAFTTSGQSRNILRALEIARARGLTTVGLTGARGTEFASACDLCLVVPSAETAQIQECHMAVCHLVCEVVDDAVLNPRTAEVIDRPFHRAFA